MKALKHQHALQIVLVGLDHRPTKSARYLLLGNCVAYAAKYSWSALLQEIYILIYIQIICRALIRFYRFRTLGSLLVLRG